MSFKATTWAFEQKVGSALGKLILIKLADNANDEGYCFPGQAHIAEAVEASRETVSRQIKKLVERGFVEIVPRYENGFRRGNAYRLQMDAQTENRCDAESHPDVTQDHSGCDATIKRYVTQDHSGTCQRTVTNNMDRSDLDAEFEEWWQEYPRKVAKPKAKQAFKAARKKVDLQTLKDGLAGYKLTKPDYQDWCHATTWLNQERWQDDGVLDAVRPANSGSDGLSGGDDDVVFFDKNERRWAERLRQFNENDYWEMAWGPKPTEGYACQAPPIVMRHFGYSKSHNGEAA